MFFCFCCLSLQQTIAQSSPLIRSSLGISGSSETVRTETNTYTIQQSVGQNSVIGTFNNKNFTLRQGFIQPDVLAKIIDKSIPLSLKATFYPNPFIEIVNISFTEKIESQIVVELYDQVGRLVFSNKYLANQNLKTSLKNLPVANYILKVSANSKQFITTIIKK